MRRTIVTATLTTIVACAATAVPLSSAAAAAKVPACADVVDGSAFYDSAGVHARMILAAPACRKVTYVLEVSDGGQDIAGTTGTPTTTSTGAPAVTFDLAVTDPTPEDQTVCVDVVTLRKKKLYDRAPDTGCVPVTIDGGAGGQGFH